MSILFLIIGAVTLGVTLYAKHTYNKRLEWIFKPLTSLMFVLTAIAAGINEFYGVVVLIGLLLGFLGDIYLISDNSKLFFLGLVVFLLGHIAYLVAFNEVKLIENLHPASVGLVIFAGLVFALLRPYLGSMLIPVLFYMVVITLMVISALNIYFESDEARAFRRLVAVGAICFYASDLGVALDRFTNPSFKQAYWSLPLYYIGQFMIALSIAEIS